MDKSNAGEELVNFIGYIPMRGSITLSGTVGEIAETIANFLGDREIHCTVEWEVIA